MSLKVSLECAGLCAFYELLHNMVRCGLTVVLLGMAHTLVIQLTRTMPSSSPESRPVKK